MFQLHSKLKEDLIFLGKLKISQLFLFPDSDNPWLVLVPEVEDVSEWHHLKKKEQDLLQIDINECSKILEEVFHPDKLNIGSLGNMVPQLHIHIISRFKTDKAWPHAIWGSTPGKDLDKIESYIRAIKKRLDSLF